MVPAEMSSNKCLLVLILFKLLGWGWSPNDVGLSILWVGVIGPSAFLGAPSFAREVGAIRDLIPATTSGSESWQHPGLEAEPGLRGVGRCSTCGILKEF